MLIRAIAEQLEAVADPQSEFNPGTIYVQGDPDHYDTSPITYADVSRYLRSATGRYVPVLFETPMRVVESSLVMVNRDWLGSKIQAARARAGAVESSTAQHVLVSRGLKVGNARVIRFPEDQPPAADASAFRDLHRKLEIQADQRKAQEAASRDAIALRTIETKLAVLEALLAEAKAKERLLTEENRSQSNELVAKDRKIQDKDLIIADLTDRMAIYAACFNPHSPLHPAALSEAFDCWAELTQMGTYDPSGPGGRGARPLVMEWLRQRGDNDIGTANAPSAKVKRLATIIGWRGAGSGAIRSK